MDVSPVPSKEAIRRIALDVLKGGTEKPKIEFKRWRKCQDLAKVISAIANTEGDERNNPLFKFTELRDDYGMLILGVDDETGNVVGLPDESPKWMRESKPDGVGTELVKKLEAWIEPVPHLDVYVFDEEAGRWIVVLIHPSNYLPHSFKKNADGVTAGEWFARHDKRTELASPADHQRLRERIARAAAEKIRRVEARIIDKINSLEAQLYELQNTTMSPSLTPKQEPKESNVAKAAHNDELGKPISASVVSISLNTVVSPSEALRKHLVKPPEPVERELSRAFDEWMESLNALDFSWLYSPQDNTDLADTISSLEEASYEIVRTLAVLVSGDHEGKYTSVVQERLEEFALEHGRSPASTAANHGSRALHAYPGVLVENALVMVAHAHANAAYLEALKTTRVWSYDDHALPWVPQMRDIVALGLGWLNQTLPEKACDPRSRRIRTLLLEEPGLVRGALPRRVRNLEQLFTQTELALSLIALKNTNGERGYFGEYIFTGSASKAACALLQDDHTHLERIVGKSLEEALGDIWRYFKDKLAIRNCFTDMSWPNCLPLHRV